jgi:hypothetical protein
MEDIFRISLEKLERVKGAADITLLRVSVTREMRRIRPWHVSWREASVVAEEVVLSRWIQRGETCTTMARELA